MVTSTADSEDVANRREQLRRWIKKHYGNSQAAFIADTGVNQGELSGLLKSKSFGEKRARSLERIAKMPAKYLEQRSTPGATKDGYSLSSALRAPTAHEGSPSYHAWPFAHVTPEQYAKLSTPERNAIEQLIALFLSRRGVKSPATQQLIHALT